MDTQIDFDLFKEAGLLTRAYCEVKGFPVPENLKSITEEEIAPYREKVHREIMGWPSSLDSSPLESL